MLKGAMRMLSIGEFSNICKVSTKTLRYYEEIGLISPKQINAENGYRYYAVEQLEKMLFISRLKSYHFSLEDIRTILAEEEQHNEVLYSNLIRKKEELQLQIQYVEKTLEQLEDDIGILKQGKSIMSYLEKIDIQLVEVPVKYLVSIRKMVAESDFPAAYQQCFGDIVKKIEGDNLTIVEPPMVLFHSGEFTTLGLDTEFAISIKEYVSGTRDFTPGLCLKTVLHGSYSGLSSVYTKQHEWAEKEGYRCANAPYEVYVVDPSEAASEGDLVTEVYYPVKIAK